MDRVSHETAQDSTDLFECAFHHATIGMALVAPNGSWLQVNRALCDIVGYTEAELLATTFQAITHAADLQTDLAFVQQLLSGEISAYRMEKRYLHREGHVVWVLLSVSLVRHTDGSPRYFISQIKDIDERKRIEAELHATLRHVRCILWRAEVTLRPEHQPLAALQTNGTEPLSDAFDWDLHIYDEVAAQHVLPLELWPGENYRAAWVRNWHPEDKRRNDLQAQDALITGKTSYINEFRCFNKMGEAQWLREEVTLRQSGDNKWQAVGYCSDITERKQTEAMNQRLISLLEQSSDFVGFADKDALPFYINAAGCAMMGLPPDVRHQVRSIAEVHPSWARDFILSKGLATATEQGRWVGESAILHRDGHETPVSQMILAHKNQQGEVEYFSTVARDISVIKAAQAEVAAQKQLLEEANVRLTQSNVTLQQLATTDSLTGLKNRRAFNAHLDEELKRTPRGSGFSLVLLDVDRFKAFNDTFGHPAGDQALRQLARLLPQVLRPADIVARFGGEEFIILLPGTDEAGAIQAAERCRTAIVEAAWPYVSITASFGVVTWEEGIQDKQSLIALADVALYQSKHQGRNRVTHASHIGGNNQVTQPQFNGP